MKILVIVDMQKDFVDGALGTPEAQTIVPKVAKLIKDSAAKDTAIVFTLDTHKENYLDTLEGAALPVEHCIENTAGWQLYADVATAYMTVATEYNQTEFANAEYTVPAMIEKPTFGSMQLQNLLYEINEENPITEITFCGLCTGICVLSNAILAKATLPEVPINVVADCCACVTPESHKTALDAMKLCQINII
jgi:nicotinamidase-related amidase